MSSSRKLPVLFCALGVLALLAACSHDSTSSDARRGNVKVMLTSAPLSTTAAGATPETFSGGDDGGSTLLSRLQNVNVTFSDLLARNLDGDLVELTVDLPKIVDLIPLINGQQVSLPTGTLPAGTYDQLVVVITFVEFVFNDGGKIALTPPGGGWTKIVAVEPFEVIDGQTTTIELRFRPFDAFRELDGKFGFFPDFECHTDHDDDGEDDD
jgi:hypothetical protein